MRKVGNAFQGIGTIAAAAGGAITGVVGAAATKFSDFGDKLDKMRDRTGFSAQALSELAHAADTSGTSIEVVEKSVRGMERVLLAAGNGSKGANEALAAIGVRFEELKGKTPEQQFEAIAAGVAAIEDPTTRAGVAMKLFGKSGTDILPLITSDMAALRQEARDLGVTMGDDDATAAAALNDAFGRVKEQLAAVFVQIGAAVAGPLADMADSIGAVIAQTIQWIQNNRDLVVLIAEVGAVLTGLGAGAYAIGTAFNVGATAVGGFGTAITLISAHPIVAAAAAITAVVGGLVAEFYAAHDAVTDFDRALQGLNGKRTFADPEELSALITRFDQLAKKSKLTKDETDEVRVTMQKLREEYGNLASAFDGTDQSKIINVDQIRAQLQAARGGKSQAILGQELTQAETALHQRQAEGIGQDELFQRLETIQKLNAELDRTKKIVGDAAPPAGVAEAAKAQAAIMAAATARVAPAAAAIDALPSHPAVAAIRGDVGAIVGRQTRSDGQDLKLLGEIASNTKDTIRAVKNIRVGIIGVDR